MKRTILFFITPLMLLLFTSGCCDCRKQVKNQKPLVGTCWQLVQLMAEDITPEDMKYTLTLHDNGTFSAYGDCNTMTGTYRMSSSRELDMSTERSTMRLCRDMRTEMIYQELLNGATHYEMDGDMMLLLRNGELVGIMKAIAE